jgi:hypothetical protein
MNYIPCRVCKANAENFLSHLILSKYKINYYRCPNCEFLQTEKPYWLDEAYQDSISITDTGIMIRNELNRKKILIALTIIKNYNKLFFSRNEAYNENILDYGAGYGILVRLLRDDGFNCYWQDKYSSNLLARGFEWKSDIKISTLLAFELLEHLEEPYAELKKIVNTYQPKTILFSTLMYEGKYPYEDWWYYSFETGQHIAFYNNKTLHQLADSIGYKFYNILPDFHIFSKEHIDPQKIKKSFQFVKYSYFKMRKIYTSKTWEDNFLMKDFLNTNIR